MDQMQWEIWNSLSELTGGEVLNLMTDWLGTQVLDQGFREFLADEGVMPELDDEEEGM